uniref:NADH-ubiquinone oxidoreductase chain 6 n=1 Tax=Paroedura picta TaxID=143630 RepID=A0A455VNF1_9SAUR|nr:NADH dehydrogenase subunit 6 [Paroedura picta]
MSYAILLFLFLVLLGGVGLASNPAPHFGIIGLVISAGAGCGVVISFGGSFVGLILLLIYLGGMLVVFAYSVAAAADSYPESWLDPTIFMVFMMYVCGLVLMLVWIAVSEIVWCRVPALPVAGLVLSCSDVSGIVKMFTVEGGGLLLVCGFSLFLALIVVLELVRGSMRGGLCTTP